jgi:uncharacterized protein (DUF58 family)
VSDNLINKIKTKLFVAANKKATNVLDGAYAAITNGRSLDFDDLRQYSSGDSVRDIDWKSSARSNVTLVRRYVADKRFPVVFIMDTGKSMNALAPYGGERKEIGLLAAGILGYLALRHGDSVSCVYGDDIESKILPSRSTESHLEIILKTVNDNTNFDSGKSNIFKQLEFFMEHKSPRSIVIVVSGDIEPSERLEHLISRVKSQHELLWISTRDADPLAIIDERNGTIVDIETNEYVPEFIKSKKSLRNIFKQKEQIRVFNSRTYLENKRVSTVSLTSPDTLVFDLIELLQRRLRERR